MQPASCTAAAQELLALAGKEAALVDDPHKQRPEMSPQELLQAETAARVPRPEALGRLLHSLRGTGEVRPANSAFLGTM